MERRQAIGGTWDLFRYPGIRSDSDMYTLSYSYKPWSNRKAIADGPDIKRYIEENCRRLRRDSQHSLPATSSVCQLVESALALGSCCQATDGSGAEHEEHYEARFLFSCSGYYSYDEGYRRTSPTSKTSRGKSFTRNSGQKIWITRASVS
ncbi:hypothetical protein UMZ34_22150 [Halopseudomonas pachastrellae]|nr:hypothetical protein UMZ34_22150 [Halopseudomonas pachastrellae]